MKRPFFIFSALFCFSIRLYAGTEYYSSIELNGFDIVPKTEVLKNSGVIYDNGRYVVNTSVLKETLESNRLIKKYKLIDKNNTLSIIVLEKKPSFVVAVVRKQNTRFCQVDENYNIIAVDTLPVKNEPLLIVSEEDLQGRIFSPRVIDFLNMADSLKKDKLWEGIKEIDIRRKDIMLVKARNRPTEFTAPQEIVSFQKINALLGYLDSLGYYPKKIVLLGDFVVIRPDGA